VPRMHADDVQLTASFWFVWLVTLSPGPASSCAAYCLAACKAWRGLPSSAHCLHHMNERMAVMTTAEDVAVEPGAATVKLDEGVSGVEDEQYLRSCSSAVSSASREGRDFGLSWPLTANVLRKFSVACQVSGGSHNMSPALITHTSGDRLWLESEFECALSSAASCCKDCNNGRARNCRLGVCEFGCVSTTLVPPSTLNQADICW
jgi:hypothetical protein